MQKAQKAANAQAVANDSAQMLPLKRLKADSHLTDLQQLNRGPSQTQGKGPGKGKVRAWSARDAMDDARVHENVDSLHSIRLIITEEYVSTSKSDSYINSVTRATLLTPAERSALLVDLARMIEADQTKTLHLLQHSLKVCQHFATEAKQQQPATE